MYAGARNSGIETTLLGRSYNPAALHLRIGFAYRNGYVISRRYRTKYRGECVKYHLFCTVKTGKAYKTLNVFLFKSLLTTKASSSKSVSPILSFDESDLHMDFKTPSCTGTLTS